MNIKKKKGNKAIIVTLSICLSVILVIIMLLTLVDPLVGKSKMKRAREVASSCSEIVISAPLYKDAFLKGAEVVINGEEARLLSDMFLSVTEKASYDGSFDSPGGFWNTKIEFFTAEDRFAIYLKDDEVYVTKDTKGYKFEIDDKQEDVYEAFVHTVNQMLDDSKK